MFPQSKFPSSLFESAFQECRQRLGVGKYCGRVTVCAGHTVCAGRAPEGPWGTQARARPPHEAQALSLAPGLGSASLLDR